MFWKFIMSQNPQFCENCSARGSDHSAFSDSLEGQLTCFLNFLLALLTNSLNCMPNNASERQTGPAMMPWPSVVLWVQLLLRFSSVLRISIGVELWFPRWHKHTHTQLDSPVSSSWNSLCLDSQNILFPSILRCFFLFWLNSLVLFCRKTPLDQNRMQFHCSLLELSHDLVCCDWDTGYFYKKLISCPSSELWQKQNFLLL